MLKVPFVVTNPQKLQFSALWSVLMSLSSQFWFYSSQIYRFGSVSLLSSTLFPETAGSHFSKKAIYIRQLARNKILKEC